MLVVLAVILLADAAIGISSGGGNSAASGDTTATLGQGRPAVTSLFTPTAAAKGACVPRVIVVGASQELCYLPKDALVAARQLPIPSIDPATVVTQTVGLKLAQVLVIRSAQGAVSQVIWLFGTPGSCSDLPKMKAIQVSEEFVQLPPTGTIRSVFGCDLMLSSTLPLHPHLWISVSANAHGASVLQLIEQRLTHVVASR